MLFLIFFVDVVFTAFYSFWLIGSRWPKFTWGTALILQYGWSGLQVCSLSLLTCARVVREWDTETRRYSVVHWSPPRLRPSEVWVGEGGCSHSPCVHVHYLCLGLGGPQHPECVTCWYFARNFKIVLYFILYV